jgi:hypothetical protein
MQPDLAGQLIGSLRRVHFRPSESAPEESADEAAACIEIETKSGRYAHVRCSPGDRAVCLESGPVRGSRADLKRHWQDLTDALPQAFDGRPAILSIGSSPAGGIAIQLSTGITLECNCGLEGPRLAVSTS